jgi:hypothetical protein
MDRILVAAFVATFIAAVVAVVGMPVFAQDVAAAPAATARDKFVAMDTDHDGRISKAEWLAAGHKERGFAMMDADHDGYLTVDEIKAGREKMKAMRDAKTPQ